MAATVPDDWLVGLLRCPVTGSALSRAESTLVARIAASQDAASEVASSDASPITGGLVNADRSWFYAVRDGIPNLVADHAIPIDAATADTKGGGHEPQQAEEEIP